MESSPCTAYLNWDRQSGYLPNEHCENPPAIETPPGPMARLLDPGPSSRILRRAPDRRCVSEDLTRGRADGLGCPFPPQSNCSASQDVTVLSKGHSDLVARTLRSRS
jgi:hypothetical protein